MHWQYAQALLASTVAMLCFCWNSAAFNLCRPRHHAQKFRGCIFVVFALALLLELSSSGAEARWLSNRRRPRPSPGRGDGRGPRPGADPGVRGREVCPTRRCRCQRRVGLWHLQCTLPLTKLPRFKATNITLETATIARRNLTKITSDAFRGLKVHHLDLSGNLFETGVSSGGFRGLGPYLMSLSLGGCRMPKIPTLALAQLPKLTVLHLEYNDITVLRKDSFKDNPQLRDLSIYRNSIKKIDRNAFNGLSHLQELKIFHNEIRDLSRKSLHGMTNLTSLDASNNLIKRLGSGAFRDLKNLKWLELGENELAYINRRTFRGLRNLKYLKLDRNPLIRIQDGAFTSTRRLRYLSLDVSNVSTVTNLTFKGLGQLKTFYLGEINRRSLPEGVFTGMVKLKFMSISNYSLKFSGLYRHHFDPQMNMAQLSIWAVPLQSCTCSVRWIAELTSHGAYVHGYCPSGQPLSCRRRHKGSRRRKGRRRGQQSPV